MADVWLDGLELSRDRHADQHAVLLDVERGSVGEPGPGTNLFSASMVALDASTGLYRNHYQMVHHDIWDYDCPSPPILFDTMIDGVQRNV